MFRTARLKLTAWYLLIIILVSICFSIAMYKLLTNELDRVERIQRIRQEHQLSVPTPDDVPFEFGQRLSRRFVLDPELVKETKNRLIIILLLINGGILGVSSLAGFFLAGRTLKPIKEMVDEQNRFITDSSHELRTPITSLKTEIEVNLRDGKLSKEIRKILESNLEEVNNLQILSDNLIKLTQYQKDNGNITFENTSLKEVVDEACKRVANMAKHKKVSIHNKVQDFSIQADRQSLSEAFVIFLDNAIKYSPKNTLVKLSSKLNDNFVVVGIKDEGIGIDEDDMSHLFERFYRADKSRSKELTPGYGLGLSIAKKILDIHGGTIEVKSKINEGTTFTISLRLFV